MAIFDHLSLGVNNIEQAASFYNDLMRTIGCDALAVSDGFIAYGKTSVQFLVMLPRDGESASAGNGTHIAFVASDKETVDRFHQCAVNNGGSCEGEPGERPEYPLPNVYTAFVRDPFGNKLEIIHNGFSV